MNAIEEIQMDIIRWCNDNTGFLTAILSIIGLILSVTAIVVSIITARLPFKKKLMLGSSSIISANVVPGISVETSTLGMVAEATNIGNRTVNIAYLGYEIKKNCNYLTLFPISRVFNSEAILAPSKRAEARFYTDELLGRLSGESCKTKLFIYAKDTEGKEYRRKAGTVGDMIANLS